MRQPLIAFTAKSKFVRDHCFSKLRLKRFTDPKDVMGFCQHYLISDANWKAIRELNKNSMGPTAALVKAVAEDNARRKANEPVTFTAEDIAEIKEARHNAKPPTEALLKVVADYNSYRTFPFTPKADDIRDGKHPGEHSTGIVRDHVSHETPSHCKTYVSDKEPEAFKGNGKAAPRDYENFQPKLVNPTDPDGYWKRLEYDLSKM